MEFTGFRKLMELTRLKKLIELTGLRKLMELTGLLGGWGCRGLSRLRKLRKSQDPQGSSQGSRSN